VYLWQDDSNTPNDIETISSGFLNWLWSGTSSDSPTNGTRDNELRGNICYLLAHKNIKKVINEEGY